MSSTTASLISKSETTSRLWPGDELSITVLSANELSREVTVATDGRIDFPIIGSLDAAGQDLNSFKRVLEAALATELIDPSVVIQRTSNAPRKIFVGGAVNAPGAFELPGKIGLLEAIIMAGDFSSDSSDRELMLIRRTEGGEVLTSVINFQNGLVDNALAEWSDLQPFDIIYVSPKRITGQHRSFRDRIDGILPIEFAIFFGIS
ncbi:MAG: polysaccharide biosynthesis/export family protein [Pseudomonadota bacterium]